MDPITLVTELGAVTTSDPAAMMLDYIEIQQRNIPDDLYIPNPPSQTRRNHKANSTQPQRPAPTLHNHPLTDLWSLSQISITN